MTVELYAFYFSFASFVTTILCGHFLYTWGIMLMFGLLVKAWLYSFAFTLPATSPPFNTFDVHYVALVMIFSVLGWFLVKIAIRSSAKHPSHVPLEYVHSTSSFLLGLIFLLVCIASFASFSYVSQPYGAITVCGIAIVLWILYYLLARKSVNWVVKHRKQHSIGVRKHCSAVWHNVQDCYVYFFWVGISYILFLFSAFFHFALTAMAPNQELYTQYLTCSVIGVYVIGLWMFVSQSVTFTPSGVDAHIDRVTKEFAEGAAGEEGQALLNETVIDMENPQGEGDEQEYDDDVNGEEDTGCKGSTHYKTK